MEPEIGKLNTSQDAVKNKSKLSHPNQIHLYKSLKQPSSQKTPTTPILKPPVRQKTPIDSNPTSSELTNSLQKTIKLLTEEKKAFTLSSKSKILKLEKEILSLKSLNSDLTSEISILKQPAE